MIQRLIVRAVDVERDDISQLHEHVVQRRRHRPRSHAAGVLARPRHDDRVRVGVAQHDGHEGIGAPSVHVGPGPPPQSDDAGQRPDVLDHGDEGAFADVLRDPGDAEEGDDAGNLGRDGKEIGVKL